VQGCESALQQVAHGCSAPVDFDVVLTEVRQLKREVEQHFLAILREIRSQVHDTDFAAMHQAILENRTQVDYACIFKAISDSRVVVDLSEVIQGVQALHQRHSALQEQIVGMQNAAGVDLSPVLRAIQQNKVEVDLSGITSEVLIVKGQLDRLLAEEGRSKVVDVDFSTVITAIGKHKVDFTEVLKCVRESKTPIDFTEVFKAINHMGETAQPVDLLPVIQEVHKLKNDLSFTKVFDAIGQVASTIRTEVEIGASAALGEIGSKIDFRADFKDIIDELAKVSAKVENLQFRGEENSNSDIKQMLEDNSRMMGNLHQEIQKSEDLAATQSFKVLEAFKNERREMPSQEAASNESVKAAREPVCTEIQAAETVILETNTRYVPNLDLSEVIEEIRTIKKELDFSPVLSGMKGVLAAIGGVAKASDVTGCLEAVAQAGRDEVLRGGLQPILEEIRGHISLVLNAVHESELRRKESASSISSMVVASRGALEDSKMSTSLVLSALENPAGISRPHESFQQDLNVLLDAIRNVDVQVVTALEARFATKDLMAGNWSEVLTKMWDTHQQMSQMSAEHEAAMLEMSRIAGSMNTGRAALAVANSAAHVGHLSATGPMSGASAVLRSSALAVAADASSTSPAPT